MALNIQGTFETNEGLQVTDLFAFLFFSFDRNRTSVSVQYFKDLNAFNGGKDYINVALPRHFDLNISPDEFINGNVILMGHNQVMSAITQINPAAIVEIITDIAPAPVVPEIVSPEVVEPPVEPEVVSPEVVEPPVEPEVTSPDPALEPPADTVSDPNG